MKYQLLSKNGLKSLGKIGIDIASGHAAVMGTLYLVERKIEIVWMASIAWIALHSSQEKEALKVWVPMPWGSLCAELSEISGL